MEPAAIHFAISGRGTYPTPVVSPEISTAVADKKAKTPRSSRTNDDLVTLSENDGEGPKQKSPRLDEPEINMTLLVEPGDAEEGGEEENPWDESCLPEDAVSFLQQVPSSCQSSDLCLLVGNFFCRQPLRKHLRRVW